MGEAGVEKSEVAIFLKSISLLIRQRRWENLIEHYQFPLPFYHQKDIVILQNASEFLQAHALRNTFLRKAGIVRLEPNVISIEDKSERRCMALVEWKHFDETDAAKYISQVRYVISSGEQIGKSKIELIEYLVPVYTTFSEHFSRVRDPQNTDPFEFLP